MTNAPDFLIEAMARRAAAGLYARVHPDDVATFTANGGGVLSIYAKDAAQHAAYVDSVLTRGARVLLS